MKVDNRELIFKCDYCGKEHWREYRKPEVGNGRIEIIGHGRSTPYEIDGLEDKKFCHQYCAMRFVAYGSATDVLKFAEETIREMK